MKNIFNSEWFRVVMTILLIIGTFYLGLFSFVYLRDRKVPLEEIQSVLKVIFLVIAVLLMIVTYISKCLQKKHKNLEEPMDNLEEEITLENIDHNSQKKEILYGLIYSITILPAIGFGIWLVLRRYS